VLQTLSILIQNIRSETAIFYLFSNNYINELITTRLVNSTGRMKMHVSKPPLDAA
jgi:Uncharacterised conserved protein